MWVSLEARQRKHQVAHLGTRHAVEQHATRYRAFSITLPASVPGTCPHPLRYLLKVNAVKMVDSGANGAFNEIPTIVATAVAGVGEAGL